MLAKIKLGPKEACLIRILLTQKSVFLPDILFEKIHCLYFAKFCVLTEGLLHWHLVKERRLESRIAFSDRA